MNASDHHSVACWDRPSHPIYGSIWAERTHPDAGKRSFAFDLVSDSLSLPGGVRKVKFRLVQFGGGRNDGIPSTPPK
jgi:hypothetical protein